MEVSSPHVIGEPTHTLKAECWPNERVLDSLYFFDDSVQTGMVEAIPYSNSLTHCL